MGFADEIIYEVRAEIDRIDDRLSNIQDLIAKLEIEEKIETDVSNEILDAIISLRNDL